ncbi:hypothetical protein ABZ671_00630 [Micromonospora sp. NPDC006766]|uniref:hypothetical protein n=1 Tax=Micromonospora sp. NPDC006766 TaxID=3154778 RepID=UPI0033DD56D1
MTYLDLAYRIATGIAHTWMFSGLGIAFFKRRGWQVPPIWRHVFHELRPFYLPAVMAVPVIQSLHDTTSTLTWINLALSVWNWWWLRKIDDDDDRWKRRRKRLTERVSVLDGRLVLVPGGAS